ncbi:MAG: hypothetical protein ACK6CU_11655 [Deltaproteobacteria bacterium]
MRVARVGTATFATYEAFTSARNRHIFLSRSADSGASWAAPVQVSTGTGDGFIAAQPRIAATANRSCVVWRDNRSGSLDVFLRAWNVGTSAFVAAEQRMDTGTAAGASSSLSADVAAEGNNVYGTVDETPGSSSLWRFARRIGTAWAGCAPPSGRSVRPSSAPLGPVSSWCVRGMAGPSDRHHDPPHAR